MAAEQPRLLALAIEAKQGLHALRSAWLDGVLTRAAVGRATAHLSSIKARALAVHGEFALSRDISPAAQADARRQFGAIWSSVRAMHGTLLLAHRHLGLPPPRANRVDATWRSLKSRFVSGWPLTALPPMLMLNARPAPTPSPPPASDPELIASIDPSRARCPVCATALDAAPHACATCGCLHHRECWEWSGGCGIFGCRKR